MGGIVGLIKASQWTGQVNAKLEDMSTLLSNHMEHMKDDITSIRDDIREINTNCKRCK